MIYSNICFYNNFFIEKCVFLWKSGFLNGKIGNGEPYILCFVVFILGLIYYELFYSFIIDLPTIW